MSGRQVTFRRLSLSSQYHLGQDIVLFQIGGANSLRAATLRSGVPSWKTLASRANGHPLCVPDAEYDVAPTTHEPTIRQSKEMGDCELILAQWVWCHSSQRAPIASKACPRLTRVGDDHESSDLAGALQETALRCACEQLLEVSETREAIEAALRLQPVERRAVCIRRSPGRLERPGADAGCCESSSGRAIAALGESRRDQKKGQEAH